MAKKSLQFGMFLHGMSVLLKRNFVIRKLVKNQGINIHGAWERFRKILCLNQSEV